MHPDPTEASHNATSVDNQDSEPSLHHGLSEYQQQVSDSISLQDAVRAPLDPPSADEDFLPRSSRDTSRGRRHNAGRISNRGDSSQESSRGSRIDEYERADLQLKAKPPTENMMFQVIPAAKGQAGNVLIEEFPNGMPVYVRTLHRLTVDRGAHALPLASPSRNAVVYEPCFSSLSQAGHDATSLAHRVCSILPRSGVNEQYCERTTASQ